MEKINQDAWEILNLDERTALSLSLGHSKSTWEAGEIMSKAHFKYLEIQKRARKFLEIFTNHLEKYNGLFPENIPLSFAFKEYLSLTILKRKNISTATHQMEDPSYKIASKRNRLIIYEIEKLRAINTDEAIDLYGLIMDFDRWNNFRILPIEVQEPSAFKRRNKARDVKHIRRITSLPQFSILTLINRYSYSGKFPAAYLPIISKHLDEKYKIIRIRNLQTIIKEIGDIGLFVFKSRAKADEFADLISKYFLCLSKDCKSGQKFWPDFRIMIKGSINYKQLENIHRSRTYLDNALFDRDKLRLRRSKDNSRDNVPSDDKLFYPVDKK